MIVYIIFALIVKNFFLYYNYSIEKERGNGNINETRGINYKNYRSGY